MRRASSPARPLTHATSAYRPLSLWSSCRVSSGTRAFSGRSTIGASTPSTSSTIAARSGASRSRSSSSSGSTRLRYAREARADRAARGLHERALRCRGRHRRRAVADLAPRVHAPHRDGHIPRRDRDHCPGRDDHVRDRRRGRRRACAARRFPRRDRRLAARMTLALAVLLGFAAGIAAGMFGVGGGILFVPTLVALGLGQVEAQATSLAAILPTVAAGTWRQASYGNVRWKPALVLGLASVAGVLGGAQVALSLPEDVLRRLFAVLLFAVAVQVVWRARSR